MSDKSKDTVFLDQVSRAEGNKEQHSITSRLAFFLHSSFMNSALGTSTAEIMYGDMQMRIGDRAGLVLVTPGHAEGAAGCVALAYSDGRVMGR